MPQFIDTATIEVCGGNGGAGCMSFRREAHVPKGGPDGGDGGKGGNVIMEATTRESTLLPYRYKRHYTAARGMHGQGAKKHGKDGDDLVLKVPLGTLVYELNPDTQKQKYLIADLTHEGEQVVIGPGGHGGKGNIHFVSSTRRAPAFAELGEPAFPHTIGLEMKLLADAALVGMPSVGKSSLIAAVSAAKPKIADYPFTTLVPNLGVVKSDEDSFVIADTPGLIEGAAQGKGLGDEFLRHIERSAVILHVIDATGGLEERDVLSDYTTIQHELKAYNPELAARPQIVVINKIDAMQVQNLKENIERIKEQAAADGYPVYEVSAVTGEGLQVLMRKTNELVKEERAVLAQEAEEAHEYDAVWTSKDEERQRDIQIERIGEGVWQIKNPQLERMVLQTDFDNDEAVSYLEHRFERLGLEERLDEAGVGPDDEVRILEYAFTNIVARNDDETNATAESDEVIEDLDRINKEQETEDE